MIGTTRSGRADLDSTDDRLRVLALEVTDAEHVHQVVRQAQALHGRLDVVVINDRVPGFGPERLRGSIR